MYAFMLSAARVASRDLSAGRSIAAMSSVLKVSPLGFPFPAPDPFLFAVYHNDKVRSRTAFLICYRSFVLGPSTP